MTSTMPSPTAHATSDDPHAATRWLDEHGDYLFAVAMNRVRDVHVAEDVVQDTLLAAMQQFDDFEGRSSLRTWLCGILRHKVIDHERRARRRGGAASLEVLDERVVDAQFNARGKWAKDPLRWSPDTDDPAESSELRDAVRACLGKLPGRSADALLLLERQEMSLDEVGKVLGQSRTAVAAMLYRARCAVRRCLEHSWFGRART